MNKFYQAVYEIVEKIPPRKVVTYGQIAKYLGTPRKVRTVIWALHSGSKLNLPFHRVVNKKGAMAPHHVFGDQNYQRLLLEDEGITFKIDGCIDMEKHLWDIDVDINCDPEME